MPPSRETFNIATYSMLLEPLLRHGAIALQAAVQLYTRGLQP